MRIYAIAIMAFSDLQDASTQNSEQDSIIPKEPGLGTLVECMPALVPAESMQAAADAARVHALDKWKPDEGWHSHQATIIPVTEAFYDAAFQAHDAGVLEAGDDEMPGQTFNF